MAKKEKMTQFQTENRTWLLKCKVMILLSMIFLILTFTQSDHMAIYGLLSYVCYTIAKRR